MEPRMSGEIQSAPGVTTVAKRKSPKKNINRFEASQRDDVIPTAESPTSASGSSKERPKTTRMRATKPTYSLAKGRNWTLLLWNEVKKLTASGMTRKPV